MTFDEAFEILLGHEGGYVDHPNDPGGATKWGISKRSYPNEDIRNLTKDRAKTLYKRDFWDRVRADELPAAIRFDVFDGAVNSGPGRAVAWLQAAVGAKVDGALGPQTMAAVQAAEPLGVLARYNGHRLEFMASLKTWPSFGRGWARRIAGNLKQAPSMPVVVTTPEPISGPLVARVEALEAWRASMTGDGR